MSDAAPQPDGEPAGDEAKAGQGAGEDEPVKEQHLQAQVRVHDAITAIKPKTRDIRTFRCSCVH